MITATCTWSSLPSHLPTNTAHKTLLMLFNSFASQTCLSSRSSPQDDPCSPERWNSNLSSVVHVLQSLILTNMHKHTHKKKKSINIILLLLLAFFAFPPSPLQTHSNAPPHPGAVAHALRVSSGKLDLLRENPSNTMQKEKKLMVKLLVLI